MSTQTPTTPTISVGAQPPDPQTVVSTEVPDAVQSAVNEARVYHATQPTPPPVPERISLGVVRIDDTTVHIVRRPMTWQMMEITAHQEDQDFGPLASAVQGTLKYCLGDDGYKAVKKALMGCEPDVADEVYSGIIESLMKSSSGDRPKE